MITRLQVYLLQFCAAGKSPIAYKCYRGWQVYGSDVGIEAESSSTYMCQTGAVGKVDVLDRTAFVVGIFTDGSKACRKFGRR